MTKNSGYGFTIGSSSGGVLNYYRNHFIFLLSLLITIMIALTAKFGLNMRHILVCVVMNILLYIILSNINGSNLAGSLPSTSYPNPPHLGHDGISIENEF